MSETFENARHMTHWYLRYDWFMYETWLIRMWDGTHSYVRHDSLTRETWLIDMWNLPQWYMRHDWVMYESWLIHMWVMTHLRARHDSLICETWLIHVWDMTRVDVRHYAIIWETWLIYARDMTHSIHDTWRDHDVLILATVFVYSIETRVLHARDTLNESCLSRKWVMCWMSHVSRDVSCMQETRLIRVP